MVLTNIIEAYKNGNQKSAKDLYLHSHRLLFATALCYVSHESAAKDILQNTYEKIYAHVDEIILDSDAMVVAWMKKICINESLMYIRRKKNWDKLQINTNVEAYLPQYDFEHKEAYKLLYNLPEQKRICFSLYAIEGYSHKEIAEQLQIKESYSRTQVARARKLLASLLQKDSINEAS